jgi:hypothetical protein
MKKFQTAVHSFVLQSGETGATVEDIAERFGFTPQLVGELLTALREQTKVFATGLTRDVGLIPASPVWRAI